MDVTHFLEFGRLKCVHMSIDTFPGAIFASAHAGEKTRDVEKHLVQAFAVLGMPKEIKTDNGPAYTSKDFECFCQQWGIHHTCESHSPTRQAVVETAHQTLKRVLLQQSSTIKTNSPVFRLAKALFTINFLNSTFEEPEPPIFCHFKNCSQKKLKENLEVLIKDPETQQIQGPFRLITWGRGYASVSSPQGLRWIPAKWVKPYTTHAATSSKEVRTAAWRRRRWKDPP